MKVLVSVCLSLFKFLDFKNMNNLYCFVFYLYNISMFLLDFGGYNYDILEIFFLLYIYIVYFIFK